jgi:hypothetical protein
MVRNIAARGCPLRSIDAFPTLAAQAQRYRDVGAPLPPPARSHRGERRGEGRGVSD